MTQQIDTARLERRRQQLYRLGLSRYEDVLVAMDRILNELSPKAALESRLPSKERLHQTLERLRSANLQVQLSAKPHPIQRNVYIAGLLLPSEGLVEHFAAADERRDETPEDPFGALSLYATLSHYGVEQLVLSDRRRRRRATVMLSPYEREFRLPGSDGAELRRLIDRALYDGERLALRPEMVAEFNAMDPERRRHLAIKGLCLLVDPTSDRRDLMVPEAFRRRGAEGVEALNGLVADIRQRLVNVSGDEHHRARYWLCRDDDEPSRALFDRVVDGQLWRDKAFTDRLQALGISLHTPTELDPTAWEVLEFRRFYDGFQRLDQEATLSGRGAKATEETVQGFLEGVKASPRETGAVRVPLALRCLANHVLITREPQPIPDETRFDLWLERPEIRNWLTEQGLQAEIGPGADGLNQRPVRLRPLA
ncbi:MAG: hypothetical protein ACFCBW_04400 [Candidatus Competibacterales bacterium]